MESVAAVVVAAGEGRRLGAGVPKAFAPLAGRPLFLHSLERLAAVPGLVEQVLVVPAGSVARVRREWGEAMRPLRVSRVVGGGARRQDSAAAGFRALSSAATVVLIHDAARPLVRTEDAARVAEAAAREGAAILAVPVSDTLKRGGADGRVTATLPRDGLWSAQTPQAFRREVYAAALAASDGVAGDATDDAALVERSGGTVRIVEGDRGNLKVTTAADLGAAEAILHAERKGAR